MRRHPQNRSRTGPLGDRNLGSNLDVRILLFRFRHLRLRLGLRLFAGLAHLVEGDHRVSALLVVDLNDLAAVKIDNRRLPVAAARVHSAPGDEIHQPPQSQRYSNEEDEGFCSVEQPLAQGVFGDHAQDH